jgi:hypothetical protein
MITGRRIAAAWDAWSYAALESRLALELWMYSSDGLKHRQYEAYLVCLEREEQAARTLAERLDPAVAARLLVAHAPARAS